MHRFLRAGHIEKVLFLQVIRVWFYCLMNHGYQPGHPLNFNGLWFPSPRRLPRPIFRLSLLGLGLSKQACQRVSIRAGIPDAVNPVDLARHTFHGYRVGYPLDSLTRL